MNVNLFSIELIIFVCFYFHYYVYLWVDDSIIFRYYFINNIVKKHYFYLNFYFLNAT